DVRGGSAPPPPMPAVSTPTAWCPPPALPPWPVSPSIFWPLPSTRRPARPPIHPPPSPPLSSSRSPKRRRPGGGASRPWTASREGASYFFSPLEAPGALGEGALDEGALDEGALEDGALEEPLVEEPELGEA